MTSRLTEVPVTPGGDEARRWVVEELSRREYQAARPGLLERLAGWVLDHLTSVSVPGGESHAVLWVLAVCGAVALGVLWWTGGLRPSARAARTRAAGVLERSDLSAAEHRALAEAAAAAGRWGEALAERFRAVTRQLEERAVLVPRAARTAAEVAAEAGAAIPLLAPDLRAAAHLFDAVVYGARAGDEAGYLRVASVDDGVARARAAAGDPAAGPVLVAPS